MTDQWHGGQSGPGERWNVNLPAVVGVVFVFFVGVVVWVVATSGGGDDQAVGGSTIASVASTSQPSSSTSTATSQVPVSTSPLPMPATTLPPPSTPAPTVPPTAAPTAPPVAPTAAPTTPPAPPADGGDLGVPGHPIQRPPCDGSFITVLGSAIGDEASPEGMQSILDDIPGSHYLRTDVTCPSLTQSRNGQPIFVIFLGPFVADSDACQARDNGPNGSYVRQLSNDLTPDHSVDCD